MIRSFHGQISGSIKNLSKPQDRREEDGKMAIAAARWELLNQTVMFLVPVIFLYDSKLQKIRRARVQQTVLKSAGPQQRAKAVVFCLKEDRISLEDQRIAS